MRLYTLFLLALLGMLYCGIAKAGSPVSYRIFDRNGTEVTFDELISGAGKSDILLFGEIHNCPITHWLELKVLESLNENKHPLTVGLEMIERDVDQVLQEYLLGTISEERYLKEGKHWDNYETDYAPLVDYAKENGIPVIGTNVPRRYADLVNRKGVEKLKALPQSAQVLFVPLSKFEPESVGDANIFATMSMMKGKAHDPQHIANLQAAQSLKDATMAWNIAGHLPPGGILVHYHGRYHSDNGNGIPHYLKQFVQDAKICTISALRQESMDKLDEAYVGIADFIIVVPEDMPTSY